MAARFVELTGDDGHPKLYNVEDIISVREDMGQATLFVCGHNYYVKQSYAEVKDLLIPSVPMKKTRERLDTPTTRRIKNEE